MGKLKSIIFVVGIMLLILAGVYVLLYVAAWCVTGGMKRRTGQV